MNTIRNLIYTWREVQGWENRSEGPGLRVDREVDTRAVLKGKSQTGVDQWLPSPGGGGPGRNEEELLIGTGLLFRVMAKLKTCGDGYATLTAHFEMGNSYEMSIIAQ